MCPQCDVTRHSSRVSVTERVLGGDVVVRGAVRAADRGGAAARASLPAPRSLPGPARRGVSIAPLPCLILVLECTHFTYGSRIKHGYCYNLDIS